MKGILNSINTWPIFVELPNTTPGDMKEKKGLSCLNNRRGRVKFKVSVTPMNRAIVCARDFLDKSRLFKAKFATLYGNSTNKHFFK